MLNIAGGVQIVAGIVISAVVFGGSAANATGVTKQPVPIPVPIGSGEAMPQDHDSNNGGRNDNYEIPAAGEATDAAGYIIKAETENAAGPLIKADAENTGGGFIKAGSENTEDPYIKAEAEAGPETIGDAVFDAGAEEAEDADGADMEAGTKDRADTPAKAAADPDIDHSLHANPAIFDSFYTREKFNEERRNTIETGSTTIWGTKNLPQTAAAIIAEGNFYASLEHLSELEKVRKINDFLCAHLSYRSGAVFSADAFWTGTAYGICVEYARMFQFMCNTAGIACVFVAGTVDGSGHAWNEVYINGAWHFYDGNLSDMTNSFAIGEAAKGGRTFSEFVTKLTVYHKELYVPGSTI